MLLKGPFIPLVEGCLHRALYSRCSVCAKYNEHGLKRQDKPQSIILTYKEEELICMKLFNKLFMFVGVYCCVILIIQIINTFYFESISKTGKDKIKISSASNMKKLPLSTLKWLNQHKTSIYIHCILVGLYHFIYFFFN
jgi:hypothetical protein